MVADGTTATREGRIDEIHRAAARLFADKGYVATSIQDVAEAVGMLKGSLYYYIDSKEQLLFDVIRGAHEPPLANVRALRDSDAPALEVLRRFVENHVAALVDDIDPITVFFHSFRHLSPAHQDVIVAERHEYDEFVRRLIERGKREGAIDEDADTLLAAMGVFGMMNWVYQWYRPGGRSKPEEIGRAIADIAIDGLVTR